jgi:hypothetical protein
MRFPIKYRVNLPVILHRLLRVTVGGSPCDLVRPRGRPGSVDAQENRAAFSRAVSVLASGSTWKTTGPRRHRLTDRLILRACEDGAPVIIDIGVSDGITSLELIEALGRRFTRFYATDVSFTGRYIERAGRTHFYDGDGRCILAATPRLVVFSALGDALFPFGWLAGRLLSSCPEYDAGVAREVSLVNPALRRAASADPRVVIRGHDMFDPWAAEPAQIIKIANVLNRDYFSIDDIRRVIQNLKDALGPGGKLFLTDNRTRERVSIFARTGDGLTLCERVNGGSDITNLVIHG